MGLKILKYVIVKHLTDRKKEVPVVKSGKK